MKNPVFLDTSYVLALLNTKDELHLSAKNIAEQILRPIITTEAVLTEIANSLSKIQWRSLAVETIEDFRNDPETEVIPVSSDLFSSALELYANRMDKEWSLTDCISFVVMKVHQLTEALTSDHHFEQAGFKLLLHKE
jgi:uncharacterized protein